MYSRSKIYIISIRLAFFAFLVINCSCRPKVFNIPTPSMEGTLPVGSKVWLTYGSVTRNDIVVFRVPMDPKTLYIFRLVAEPGDQLKISNGQVSINRRRTSQPDSVQYMYQVSTSVPIEPIHFERLGIWDHFLIQGGYAMYATPAQANKLEQAGFIASTKRQVADPDVEDSNLHEDFKWWNKDHFGPLYIPKASDVVSGEELQKYANLILTQEGVDVGGVESYTFKKSYCFVMGDNRDNALDSRYIGLIPMEDVLGPAKLLF